MEKYTYKSTTFDHMEKSLKSQLKAMDIVKLQNGLIGFISYNEYSKDGLAIYSPRYQGCFTYLNKYHDDLSSKIKEEHNIVAIYRGPKSYCVLEDLFSDVANELTDNHENNKENDIIAIYRGSRQFAILDLMFSNENNEEIEACIMRDGGWTLEINNIKKMTLEDIEKALGYKFELI